MQRPESKISNKRRPRFGTRSVIFSEIKKNMKNKSISDRSPTMQNTKNKNGLRGPVRKPIISLGILIGQIDAPFVHPSFIELV